MYKVIIFVLVNQSVINPLNLIIMIKKPVNRIYRSSDLSIFKLCDKNRSINQGHVKKLVKSMKVHGFLPDPIRVSDDYIVIDGQHRLEAARKVGIPVLYFIDNTGGNIVEKMVLKNTGHLAWSKMDYITVNLDKPSYRQLELFRSKYPDFRLTEQLMFLSNSPTNVDKDLFASGRWVSKDIDIAVKWVENLRSLKPYFEEGYNLSIFVRAMIEIMYESDKNGFDFKEFLHKVELRPSSIYRCGDKRTYKQMIENIYNYRKRSDDKINLRGY